MIGLDLLIQMAREASILLRLMTRVILITAARSRRNFLFNSELWLSVFTALLLVLFILIGSGPLLSI